MPLILACPVCCPFLMRKPCDTLLHLAWESVRELDNDPFRSEKLLLPRPPKGYQVSQFLLRLSVRAFLKCHWKTAVSPIRITRAHLEEDAGKSVHDEFAHETGIDLNRAGTPLLEIVTEPDFRSAEQAVAYLKALHSLVTYLGISDGNMAEGSMRCDINISLRKAGIGELGTRTEIKNVNSFRFVERAIHSEYERQAEILESGGAITQEHASTMLITTPPARCAPRRWRMTIATSPSRISYPSSLMRPTLLQSGKAYPSCPRQSASDFGRVWGERIRCVIAGAKP